MTRSNSRRFVSAAWSLLTFQLIASAGAVAVTGYAALHVRDLVSGAQPTAEPVDAAEVRPPTTPEAASPAPADGVAPAAAAATSPATAPDVVAPAPPATAAINEGTGTLLLRGDDRGSILATLSDPDGIAERSQIQWFRNGAHVRSADGSLSYAIRDPDSGAAITARMDYVDGRGFRESVMSAPYQVGNIIR